MKQTIVAVSLVVRDYDEALRLVVSIHHRRSVLQKDTPTDQAVSMKATAAELPPTADFEATVDAVRLADRRQPARGQ